ncbi:hypothetical protein [Caballeronia concitans]|jgi:hypothetical protein|uniref:Uncharacterized protein n=1 Tax=Caballeronia concitans TaxID=1777133 RepID=A0A658R3C5_9BURK|nr:hypothetical protein [Caballeronia concitans]KIG01664.1 hypothetical protein BurMR1_1249 [Burkholderia sp. MR1]SAL46439.1 hypothetical protein AWB72_04844 [Caballeronia concitans]
MEAKRIERIASALRRAAEQERLLPYQRFHAMFGPDDPLATRYDALEKAVASLGELSAVDYGALLTLYNGLPGPEFFRRARKHRFDDYVSVMGAGIHWESIKRKRALVEVERRRVYDDAKLKAAARVVETV